jgi:2-polyprenyl-3-methyl-5-hydroxy-6-metoxy-1,4-benzoquinol methylase
MEAEAFQEDFLMPVNWMDVSELSFNSLLLLERVQISWFPGKGLDESFALALSANPAVEWFLRHKCPEVQSWLNGIMSTVPAQVSREDVRSAELAILRRINDLLVYVVDPAFYDAQPFLGWDSRELTWLVDFSSKTVLDIGAGTGRLALVAAEKAAAVFAVEPVANLRAYLRDKCQRLGLANVYPVDGIVTQIPFPNAFADVVMGGHVFGDEPEQEYCELARVAKPGGMIILCPGNGDKDDERHRLLLAQGFQWSRFEEPRDGTRRKYWKTAEAVG